MDAWPMNIFGVSEDIEGCSLKTNAIAIPNSPEITCFGTPGMIVVYH